MGTNDKCTPSPLVAAVAIFTEGDFDGTVWIAKELASAYAKGVQDGAGRYGAGSCHAVVWPPDPRELDELTSLLGPSAISDAERAVDRGPSDG